MQSIFSKHVRKLFFICFSFVLLFSLFDFKNFLATEFDSISTGLECILFISFSIIYLYERISKVDGFVYDLPEFWVVFGIIIYFSGNFFIFIFAQNSLNQNSFKETFNTINAISSIIENIMFLIAFVIAKRQFKPLKQKKVSRLKPEFQSNS